MPTPSGTIRLSDLVSILNQGNSLSNYRGKLFSDASSNAFVISSSAPISFSQLRSKSLVSSGSSTQTTAGSSSYTIPLYKTITFTLKGGGGGGGGGGGTTNDINNCSGSTGSAGTAGGQSSFGNQGDAWRLVAAGGGGGSGGTKNTGAAGANGTNGAGYDGVVARANGGTASATTNSGGLGGGGGVQTITLTNPLLGGTGPTSGSSISYIIGAGGSLGAGGSGGNYYTVWTGAAFVPVCDNYPARAGGSGAAGSAGSLAITWTGT